MKMRSVIFGTLSILAAFIGGSVQAQEYPTRPIRLVVPFAPGGGADVTARIAAEALTRQFGQQVVVENRAGATGIVGTTYVAGAEPDGYTLLWTTTDNFSIAPAIRKELSYNVEELSFIARFAENGHVYAVNTNRIQAKTLAEFVTYLKEHPGEVRYGTNGIGSANHLSMAVFEDAAGVKMTRVVYQSMAPTITDLLAGRLEIVPTTPATIAPYMKSDAPLRLLTITQSERNALFPDVPTIVESGYPTANVSVWYGMAGPNGLSPDIQARLEEAMARVAEDPKVKAIMSERGLTPASLYGEDFRNRVLEEVKQFREIAVRNNIKPE
jgi:tripartite-type tricarboxylate transporter receptor subunit TctC